MRDRPVLLPKLFARHAVYRVSAPFWDLIYLARWLVGGLDGCDDHDDDYGGDGNISMRRRIQSRPEHNPEQVPRRVPRMVSGPLGVCMSKEQRH